MSFSVESSIAVDEAAGAATRLEMFEEDSEFIIIGESDDDGESSNQQKVSSENKTNGDLILQNATTMVKNLVLQNQQLKGN